MSIYRQQIYDKKQQIISLHDLIKQLLNIWSNKKVQQRYQNYYLMYLDTLPKNIAQKNISKQIKLTLENKNYYFKINKLLNNHDHLIEKIHNNIDQSTKLNNIQNIDFKYISNLFNQLRNINLQIAQLVLSFNYQSLSYDPHNYQLIQGNNYIFQKINDDNTIIKSSFLKKYIIFSNSYDPFFLNHYQQLKKQQSSFKKQNINIIQLFNLTVSQAYKYMKAQQQILQFLSGKNPNKYEYKTPKKIRYQFINDKNLKQQQQFKDKIFKLENDIYMSIKDDKIYHFQDLLSPQSKTQQNSLSSYMSRLKKYTPTNISYHSHKYKLPKLQNIKTQNNLDQYQISRNSILNPRKYSQEDSNKRYTFKIKKTNLNRPTKQLYSPFYKEGYISSLKRIKRRQQQLLRYSTNPLDDEITYQQNPISYKYPIQTPNLRMRSILPQKIEKIEQKNPKQFKNFKLKAGNLKIDNILIFLKELGIRESYRKVFEIGNFQHSLKNNQYYLHKFYIDEVLQAISLCCALPEGDILIKYWAPLQSCDEQMSNFLFKRYLEHIQKNSIAKCIYFNSIQISEVTNNGFLKQKQRIYVRSRITPQQVDNYNYYPFLSINLSILAVSKSSCKDYIDSITINSNTTVPFNQKQFICFNYLLIISKIMNLSNGYSSFATYTPNIKNYKDIVQRLIKQQMNQFPYNTQINIGSVNLTTLKIKNPLFSAFFLSNHPVIKLSGQLIYQDDQSLLVSLRLLKYNTKLYFGKGFKSIPSMISVIKNKNQKSIRNIQYCLRMFSKRMRGRIISINLRDQYCFGDFDVVFQWKDFLRGKIEHNLNEYELFGDEQFYCILQIQKQHILGFQIKTQNLI